MPRPHRADALSDDARLTSVAYIGPKSRTERPRKTKIGTEVAHITRDSDTTFKVKSSKVNLQGPGAYCGGLPQSLQKVNTQVGVDSRITLIISDTVNTVHFYRASACVRCLVVMCNCSEKYKIG